jgi:hypothetical protein
MQKFEKVNELVQPAAIQWGKLIDCLQSLKSSLSLIHQIVTRDFIHGNAEQRKKHKEIHDAMCNPSIHQHLTTSIEILKPTEIGIKLFQSCIPLSLIYDL